MTPCRLGLILLITCLISAAPGCRTVAPFGPANLEAPGWSVHQGQAVWQRPKGAEIAGEILLGTRVDGRSFAQFSKNGFPLLIAQNQTNSWEVEIPSQKKRYSGRGLPPERLLLLYLPRALAGQALPPTWSWTVLGDGNWRLENRGTRESLEGYFNP